jgi:hypothetical protein
VPTNVKVLQDVGLAAHHGSGALAGLAALQLLLSLDGRLAPLGQLLLLQSSCARLNFQGHCGHCLVGNFWRELHQTAHLSAAKCLGMPHAILPQSLCTPTCLPDLSRLPMLSACTLSCHAVACLCTRKCINVCTSCQRACPKTYLMHACSVCRFEGMASVLHLPAGANAAPNTLHIQQWFNNEPWGTGQAA